MSGLGGTGAGGKVVTVQTPLPEDVDGILERVREIILLGEVQSIAIKIGEPIIYQRLVRPGEEISASESTQSFTGLSIADIVRNVPMREWDAKDQTPHEQIWGMFMFMSKRFWATTHILISEDSKFWSWLGLDETAPIHSIFGARVETDTTLPDHVFIICGASSKNATISEINFSLKGNIP